MNRYLRCKTISSSVHSREIFTRDPFSNSLPNLGHNVLFLICSSLSNVLTWAKQRRLAAYYYIAAPPWHCTPALLALLQCNFNFVQKLFVNPSWFWCHSGDCSILAGEQRQEEGSLSTWATLHHISDNQFYWNMFINLVVWTIWCSDSDIATQENLPESSDLTSIMISDWLLLEYFKCSIFMFSKIYLTCKVLCSWSFLH